MYSGVPIPTPVSVRVLGYVQAPVVMAGGEHWSGYRPDKIKGLVLAAQELAVAV